MKLAIWMPRIASYGVSDRGLIRFVVLRREPNGAAILADCPTLGAADAAARLMRVEPNVGAAL